MVDSGRMIAKKQGSDARNLMESSNHLNGQASCSTLPLRPSIGLVDLVIERSSS